MHVIHIICMQYYACNICHEIGAKNTKLLDNDEVTTIVRAQMHPKDTCNMYAQTNGQTINARSHAHP